MNTRKINLALTAGLINKNHGNGNALQSVIELMSTFAEDVGVFLGLSPLSNQSLNDSTFKQSYALRYENCTLKVDLITSPKAKRQMIQRFQLR